MNLDKYYSVENKYIFITGASSGIGRCVAQMCNENGAFVVLLARDNEKLDIVQSNLKFPDKSKKIIYDLSNLNGLEAVIEEFVAKYGKISGYVHSAGLEQTLPLKVLDQQSLRNIFQVNVFSAIEISRILSKKKNFLVDDTSFVFISSIMSEVGQPGKIAYSASKSSLLSMTKSMALELSSKNIRVNSVSPAMVETPLMKNLFKKITLEKQKEIESMHPLGFGKPEDIALAVIYLLSKASKWVTGTNLIIDGGYSSS